MIDSEHMVMERAHLSDEQLQQVGQLSLEALKNQEAHSLPILTAEEESLLFGCYSHASKTSVKEMLSVTGLTVEHMAEEGEEKHGWWSQIVRSSGTVEEVIVACYKRWAAAAAKDYLGWGVLTFDDRLSAAYEGLSRAMKKFEPSLGNRFTTFSAPHLHERLQYVECEELGVSVHIGRQLRALDYIAYGFQEIFGFEANAGQLGQQALANADGKDGRPIVYFAGLRNLAQMSRQLRSRTSLDAAVYEDTATSLIDRVPALNHVEHEAEASEAIALVAQAFRTFSDQQRHLVLSTLGILGEQKSVAAVAREMGLTIREADGLLASAQAVIESVLQGRDVNELLWHVQSVESLRQRAFSEEELMAKISPRAYSVMRVARLAIEGKTIEVRDILGITNERIRQIRDQLIALKLPAPLHDMVTGEYGAEIDRLFEEGYGADVIADRLNMTIRAVQRRVHGRSYPPFTAVRMIRDAARTPETDRLRKWMADNPRRRPGLLAPGSYLTNTRLSGGTGSV